MILKTCFLLAVGVAWEVSGASYSNVFVQTGPDSVRSEYLPYSSPAYKEYVSSAAQYNVAPSFSYEFPYGQNYYRTTYQEPAIATVAAPAPSANVVAYSSPISSIPYSFGINEPAASYSYVLVNQGSGQDLKLSDGEVIRGGYTFVQPEGLVQYVTDDNQGLNAILKAYIPTEAVSHAHTETVHHETIHHDSGHHTEPCREAKSEAMTEITSHESSHEEHHGGHEHHESHEEHGKEHEPHHESHEARHGGHEEPIVEYVVHASHGEPESHDSERHSHEEHITRIIIQATSGEEEHDTESEERHDSHGHHETEHEEHSHHHKAEHEQGHHEAIHEELTHESHESGSHESHHTHEAIVEVSHGPHEKHEHHEGHVVAQVPVPVITSSSVNTVNVHDFIKCIQAAMARGNSYPYYAPVATPVAAPASPLTYLILNKPC